MNIKADLVLIKGEQSSWDKFDANLGWKAYFNNVHVVSVPGDHQNIIKKSAKSIDQTLSKFLM